jgi:uncharacterized membrane protein YccF (DUF307 family)
MRTIGNILWLLLAGLWLALSYLVAAVVAFVLIITIPFGIASLRLAAYALWPFGRTVIPSPERGAMSVVGNVVWFLVAGWWLALAHLVTGLLLCLTIIGLPLGIANLKMIPLAFAPFGKQIVPIDSLTTESGFGIPSLR